ncbi:MAG TPA: radical SAM protein [Xanthomonadales bacterium]|nr:radical SAM protein [Xanthomonadales bacterium]
MNAIAKEVEAQPVPRVARTQRMTAKHLQVVVKTAERCNLACTYCYYFFAGDERYRERPAIIPQDTVRALAEYLVAGCVDLGIPKLAIAFHGGEPMLQKPRQFDETCAAFRAAAEGRVELAFSMQTNGTLVSDRWLELLHRHGVAVGVSIDGTREQHDAQRVDHRGRGSFDRVVDGIRRLQASNKADSTVGPAIIGVLDHRYDQGETYRFLRRELDIRRMSFLLPDVSHDHEMPNGGTALDYGRALCQLFDAWAEEDDPDISVRVLDEFIGRIGSARAVVPLHRDRDGTTHLNYQILVAHSDGTVALNDSYTPALDWLKAAPVAKVDDGTPLRAFLDHPVFDAVDDAMLALPAACRGCEFRGVCRGGEIENRYSRANGFDNPSVYCEGLKLYYRHVLDWLVANGYPAERVAARLETAADVVDA